MFSSHDQTFGFTECFKCKRSCCIVESADIGPIELKLRLNNVPESQWRDGQAVVVGSRGPEFDPSFVQMTFPTPLGFDLANDKISAVPSTSQDNNINNASTASSSVG